MTGLICGIDIGGQSLKISLFPFSEEELKVKEEDVKVFGLPKYNFADEKTPSLVLEDAATWIEKMIDEKKGKLVSIGIACFGPVQLQKDAPNYGYITSTPKVSWQNKDVVGVFKKRFPSIPIGFDTDVNAPALHEAYHFKCHNLAYITVGTGIGVGLCVNSAPVHGLVHPEGGHMHCPIHEIDRKNGFFGFCKFHPKGCIEGFCAAQAIGLRTGKKKEDIKELKEDDPVFDLVAHYLSHLCCHLLYLLSLEKIVISGGVMSNPTILPKIRKIVPEILGNYLQHDDIKNIERIIVPSDFHPFSGVYGALELAKRSLIEHQMFQK